MSLSRRIFFNFAYLGKPPWDTGITPPEVFAYLDSHPPGRALDLGCGTGTNAITLAQRGWQVSAVDYARLAVWFARRNARHARINAAFYTADVTRLDFLYGTFDLILDIGCFHNLSPRGKSDYTLEVERLLAVGGTLLLYGFFSVPEHPGSGMTPADLELLGKQLRLTARVDGAERRARPSAWLTFEK